MNLTIKTDFWLGKNKQKEGGLVVSLDECELFLIEINSTPIDNQLIHKLTMSVLKKLGGIIEIDGLNIVIADKLLVEKFELLIQNAINNYEN